MQRSRLESFTMNELITNNCIHLSFEPIIKLCTKEQRSTHEALCLVWMPICHQKKKGKEQFRCRRRHLCLECRLLRRITWRSTQTRRSRRQEAKLFPTPCPDFRRKEEEETKEEFPDELSRGKGLSRQCQLPKNSEQMKAVANTPLQY